MVSIVGTNHIIIGKGSQPAYYIKAGRTATHNTTTAVTNSTQKEATQKEAEKSLTQIKVLN